MSEACEQEPYDWSDTRTLYVILQGEFVLYHEVVSDNPITDRLRILAPYLCDHQYKAGPWLTAWQHADELPRVLSLKNAFGDRKRQPLPGGPWKHHPRAIPENNTDIIMSVGPEKLCAENARLDISAPMPLAILPGLIETTESVWIKLKQPDGSYTYPPVPPYPTIIPILVYKWYDGDPPYLWNEHSGQSWPSGGPAGPLGDFQSIHVYASSPVAEDSDHARKAFKEAAALLGEKAEINWTEGAFSLIHATPPAGLSWAQVNMCFSDIYDLDPSDQRLILDEVDLSDGSLSPALVDALTSSNSGNCGPVTGGH